MSEKLMVIGLDGATFRIIKPLVDQGRLPTFRRLLDKGVHGVLESTPDTNSPCAWSTFITGKNPGKHGIFGFFESEPNSYRIRFLNGSFRTGKPIWKILSEQGKKVGVMNVPFSYPVEEVNGFILAGPDSPSKDDHGFCYPVGIVGELEKSAGNYIIEAGASALVRQGKPTQAIDKLHECIEARVSATKYLLRKGDYDFFMVVFTESDRVQHHFWKYINPLHPAYSSPEKERFGNAIYDIYERLDSVLGEIISVAGRNYAIMLISDHGAGPSSNNTFFMNRWLESAGYLSLKSNDSLQDYAKYLINKGFGNTFLFAKSHLGRGWKRRLRNIMPGMKNKASSALRSLQLDWQNTKAFSWENAPIIYLNVKGRFPLGTVEPGEEYEAVRKGLVQELLNIVSPYTGKKVVKRVLKKEQVYWGPFRDKAPDLFIEWVDDGYTVRPGYASKGKGFIEVITGDQLKKVETISRPSGVHMRDGIFILSGNSVEQGKKIEVLRLYDVTLLILYYLGVPIPGDFDGKVPPGIFTEEFLEKNEIQYTEFSSDSDAADLGYSKEESDVIAERLKGLGYID